MKRVIAFFSFFILFMNIVAAQNGLYDVRFTLKSADCVKNKLVIQVQVKAHDAQHAFLMGDANYRFEYDPLRIHNPKIVKEETFSSVLPANDNAYNPQNLSGSSEGPTKALVSLNTIFSGTSTNAKLVSDSWISVSCIEFDIIDNVTCSSLIWHTAVDFPITRMNEIIIPSSNALIYETIEVSTGNVFENLQICPIEACKINANNPPLVAIPAINMYQDQTYSNCVKVTDIDVNDVHTATICSNPTNGTLSFSLNPTTRDFCYTYIPKPNYFGTDQFCVNICDNNKGCVSTPVPITIIKNSSPANSCLVDIEPPVAVGGCPSEIKVNMESGKCGATVNLPSFVDNCSSSSALSIVSNAPANNFFPVGTQKVHITATDKANNTLVCDINVSVLDISSPVSVTCPIDITVNTTQSCSVQISLPQPVFVDNCNLTGITISNDAPLNNVFSVGSTLVTFRAKDASGNEGICSYHVVVLDKIAPVFTLCPSNITITSKDSIGRWKTPEVTDNCDTNPLLISTYSSGMKFVKKVTSVVYTAADASGNTSTCRFNVFIAPSITIDSSFTIDSSLTIVCPSNIILTASLDNCGATARWNPPIVNAGPFRYVLSSNIDSGSFFPIGTTTVVYSAVNEFDTKKQCNFTVTVNKISAPIVFLCPKDITVYNTESSCNALAYWQEPTVIDKCSNATIEMTSNYKPSSSFVLGTTAVTYQTIDGKASCSFNVTVKDTIAPAFACPKNIHVSALGQIVNDPLGMVLNVQKGTSCKNVQLNFDLPDAKDNCSGAVNIAQIDKTGLSSGDYFPVGKTVLQFRATDLRGNKSFCEIPIIVDSIALPKILVENQKVCEGNAIYLKTEVVAGAKYKWVGPNGFTSTESNPVIGVSKASNAGKYALTVNFNDVCAASISDTINIAVINAIKAVADVDTIRNTQIYEGNVTLNDKIASGEAYVVHLVSQPSVGTLVMDATGRFTYTPIKDYVGTVQFIYEICYNSCLSNCDKGIVTLEVRPNGSVCVVPTIITPNDDGLNDALYIDCLDERTNNQSEILIFNQWGDLVYSASPYKNDWKGTHKGKLLPDGTYYYLFKESATAVVKKGFVTIFK